MDSIQIDSTLYLTLNRNILEDISQHRGPKKFRLFVGCHIWNAQELLEDLKNPLWIQAHINFCEILTMSTERLWEAILEMIGYKPYQIHHQDLSSLQ